MCSFATRSGADPDELRDRLIDALITDFDSDGFNFFVGPAAELRADEAGRNSWRFSVKANLAGRAFDVLKLDVAPRSEELETTEHLMLPTALAIAGFEPQSVELIDVNRHAAEKIHAFTRVYGDRPSSRVRDLVDLVLLIENELLDKSRTVAALRQVFEQRATHKLPTALADPPSFWIDQYANLVVELTVDARTLDAALVLLSDWWRTLFPASTEGGHPASPIG